MAALQPRYQGHYTPRTPPGLTRWRAGSAGSLNRTIGRRLFRRVKGLIAMMDHFEQTHNAKIQPLCEHISGTQY